MEMKTLLAEMIPELLKNFPWPKSMRWPQNKDGSGDFRWVRPLRSVLCILDNVVVPFSVGGVDASNKTYGHIFDAPDEITISSFDDYKEKLRAAHVLISPDERHEKIKQQIKEKKENMYPQLESIDLFVNQVIRISENPILRKSEVVWESEDPYLDMIMLPEKIRDLIFIKENCLPLFLASTWGADFFACIDENKDNKDSIVQGFSAVLRARMKDALFYIDQDHQTGLDRLREKLKDASFHPKLGSIYDKAERFEKLSLGHTLRALFPDEQWKEVIQRAAHYAKADIASQSGREFPEALGEIASVLFYKQDPELNKNIGRSIITAFKNHYNPVPPTNPGRILALADRADTLAGFFSIDEMPTGSKDPFALRRSALSIIRIILENETDFQKLDLNDLFAEALDLYGIQDKKPVLENLRAFITERLKFYLRAQDQSADFVAAAMRAESGLNLVRIQARLRALAQFLNTKDGDHLMTAWRRLSGILKETSGGSSASTSASDCANPPAIERFTEPAEHALAQALRLEGYDQALAVHDFPRAFALLAQLRAPVDDFFDNVRVNVDDPATASKSARFVRGFALYYEASG